ncbi:11925_t:CDS:2 [Ambispora gerdemannii]|uniref:Mitochondrial zinc maintenance protein 1, mitochondrial n=1 Tax=Ambispora gerdemannii TaxID=144530 RepID=A0A9N8ZZD0_9GLOM|nr:11925_t:CDS:2 [Ambispora gerdemannii]
MGDADKNNLIDDHFIVRKLIYHYLCYRTQKKASLMFVKSATTSRMLRHAVLRAYRDLLKAQQETFYAARDKTREEFLRNRSLNEESQIQEQINRATEIANTLRRNVVQAVSLDQDKTRFRLLLNENHELGDNDSLKLSKSSASLQKSS